MCSVLIYISIFNRINLGIPLPQSAPRSPVCRLQPSLPPPASPSSGLPHIPAFLSVPVTPPQPFPSCLHALPALHFRFRTLSSFCRRTSSSLSTSGFTSLSFVTILLLLLLGATSAHASPQACRPKTTLVRVSYPNCVLTGPFHRLGGLLVKTCQGTCYSYTQSDDKKDLASLTGHCKCCKPVGRKQRRSFSMRCGSPLGGRLRIKRFRILVPTKCACRQCRFDNTPNSIVPAEFLDEQKR